MWFLDINIVLLYHLIHDVIAFFVSEVGNNRNRLVGLGFFDNLGIINNDFGMEDFLVDALSKLSETAPTNIPCVSVDLAAGGRETATGSDGTA